MPTLTATTDARLAAIAATRCGVVTLADTDAVGMSRRTVSRRVAEGHLHRVHPGVFAVGHPGLDLRGRAIAGLLACGPEHLLTHASCAALWDVGPWPAEPHVTGTGRRRIAGVRYHEATVLPPLTTRYGLPTTTVEALVLDLAEDAGDLELFRVINELLYQRRTTPDRIAAHLASQPGRRGRAVLGALLPYVGSRHSHLEDDFHGLLREADLHEPETNRYVNGRQVDFWWPLERVVVETDGWAKHGTRTSFEVDRDRDAALLALGIVTMRVTASQLATKRLVVATRLGAVLLGRR